MNQSANGTNLANADFEGPRLSGHRRVLSTLDTDIQSSDESQSEEVEGTEDDSAEGDAGHSIVGISIGSRQDRLRAPQTPATEKEEALAGQDPFDAALRDHVGGKDGNAAGFDGQDDRAVQPSEHQSHISTVQSHSEHASESDASRQPSLRHVTGRHRAFTGPFAPSSSHQSKKSVGFSLPSLPSLGKVGNRFSLPTIDSALQWVRGGPTEPNRGVPASGKATDSSVQPIPERRSSLDSRRDPPGAPLQRRSRSRSPPLLRRSTSDSSLTLARTASRASSLGDDSRFEDIQAQVNSRMKAIKDSWADTNIRIPRLRPTWLDSYKANGNTVMLRGQPRKFGGPRDAPMDQTMQNTTAHKGPPMSPPGGMSKIAIEQHPEFTKALKRLTGDVVILGGYRGSVLRSAEPPNRQLWIPVKVGLNIRKVNLEVGLDHEDEMRMPETIIPSGTLKNIGPVDISRRLFKRLQGSHNATNGSLRVWDYGYDWRLSPHLLSRQLEDFLAGLPCNKSGVAPERRGATVIAHSLGGLLVRHVINRRPDLVSGVIYAGAPYQCINILGPLRNGDSVLMSSKVLTAQVNFTIRTSFALLPLDGRCFVDEETREQYHVDFFDPKSWEGNKLSPCIARPLPPLVKEAEPQSLVSSLVGSMASVLPSVNGRRNSMKRPSRSGSPDRHRSNTAGSTHLPAPVEHMTGNGMQHNQEGPEEPMSTQINALPNPQEYGASQEQTVSTAVTIPRDRAWEYLVRTLAEVKAFKQELSYIPDLESHYPPAAVIYGKSVPTVCGAKVKGREGIKRADAYERLQFASGDGVVLARAAQLPEGYKSAPGGVVSSDRGHIGLLGDLEAVGRCLNAITREKRRRREAELSEPNK